MKKVAQQIKKNYDFQIKFSEKIVSEEPAERTCRGLPITQTEMGTGIPPVTRNFLDVLAFYSYYFSILLFNQSVPLGIFLFFFRMKGI